jgi:hypothetical protein
MKYLGPISTLLIALLALFGVCFFTYLNSFGGAVSASMLFVICAFMIKYRDYPEIWKPLFQNRKD